MKIAVISDIHEDLVSLQLAIRKIEKAKCEEVVCLGDIAGFSVPHYDYYYSRNGHACLELVKQYCRTIIPGNHDMNAARRIPSITQNFEYPDNWYEMAYQEKKELGDGSVWLYDEDELNPLFSNDDIELLKVLPEFETIDIGGIKILFSHYFHPNITGMETHYFSKAEELQLHFEFMKEQGCRLSFCGHAHSPGIFLAYPDRVHKKAFGKKRIEEMPASVVAPAIANGTNANGFLIFDTETRLIETKRL